MSAFGTFSSRPLLILDFDSEVRPMHYSEWRPEGQLTAIAWSWYGNGYVRTVLLEADGSNEAEMIAEFIGAYDAADMVTGHYIRKHDLPLINDGAIRLGLPPLKAKLTSDTQADMVRVKSLGKSQDNLAVTFDMDESKHHMTGADWRRANMLGPEGQRLTHKRVRDDVLQHKALREEMLRRGILGSPKVWHP